MPPILVIWICKAIIFTSRLTGRGGGSALPGLVAERLNSSIGFHLASRLTRGSIIVTGTNGKTTTSKILVQMLADHGEHLVTNRAGSNLSRGIVSTLIDHASWGGRMRGELGLFEVDEAALPAVVQMVKPRAILVLNLFRDQLDRYGELDTTAGLIGNAIANSGATVYLNADDPLVAGLASYAQRPEDVHYFGLDDIAAERMAGDMTADSINCPVCGRALTYSKHFFGHMGHYRCPNNDFRRPKPEYQASDLKLAAGGADFTLSLDSESQPAKLYLPGAYNVYNAVGALALASGLGVQLPTVIQALPKVTAAFGRVERVVIDGRIIYLLLVKNPTGFNQVLQTFLLDKKRHHVMFAINDLFADGRDVSWLWDVAFEELSSREHVITVSGIRAADMALRLKYAEVPVVSTQQDMQRVLKSFIDGIPAGETGYIAPTYTAMRQIRQLLGRQVKLKGEWE